MGYGRTAALALGAKRCEMAAAEVAQQITGYVVGGKRGLDVELSPDDLGRVRVRVRVLDARVAAIAVLSG